MNSFQNVMVLFLLYIVLICKFTVTEVIFIALDKIYKIFDLAHGETILVGCILFNNMKIS